MGHQLIEPYGLEFFYSRREYFDVAVVMFHWLIHELYIELKEELKGIEIRVVDGTHHHPNNYYPALGVFYTNATPIVDMGPLIEETIERLINKKPISEFVRFAVDSGINWKRVTSSVFNRD